MALMNKAVALANLGRLPEALAGCDEAITLYKRLVDTEGRAELADALALALMNKAVTLANLGRLPEALAGYDEAITLYKRLVDTEGRAELADDLAKALVNKASALERLKQWQDALTCYDKAISCREICVQTGMSHVLPELLRTIRYRMIILLELRQWDAVAADVVRALAYATPFLQAGASGSVVQEVTNLCEPLRYLANNELEQVCAALGEWTEVVRRLMAGDHPD
jgi:tetratricopeptide (TPR) repeat protein